MFSLRRAAFEHIDFADFAHYKIVTSGNQKRSVRSASAGNDRMYVQENCSTKNCRNEVCRENICIVNAYQDRYITFIQMHL